MTKPKRITLLPILSYTRRPEVLDIEPI